MPFCSLQKGAEKILAANRQNVVSRRTVISLLRKTAPLSGSIEDQVMEPLSSILHIYKRTLLVPP